MLFRSHTLTRTLFLVHQVVYFASNANETAQVAKVMARQRSSKKPGRPLVVDCQMRVKPAAPLVLNGKATPPPTGSVTTAP